MPHWSGLLTKADISAREATYTSQQVKDDIDFIVFVIRSMQVEGLVFRRFEVNKVVHDDVVKFFKNEMQYTVIDNKAGQAPTMTLLTEISW